MVTVIIANYRTYHPAAHNSSDPAEAGPLTVAVGLNTSVGMTHPGRQAYLPLYVPAGAGSGRHVGPLEPPSVGTSAG